MTGALFLILLGGNTHHGKLCCGRIALLPQLLGLALCARLACLTAQLSTHLPLVSHPLASVIHIHTGGSNCCGNIHPRTSCEHGRDIADEAAVRPVIATTIQDATSWQVFIAVQAALVLPVNEIFPPAPSIPLQDAMACNAQLRSASFCAAEHGFDGLFLLPSPMHFDIQAELARGTVIEPLQTILQGAVISLHTSWQQRELCYVTCLCVTS
jgi:hypothetical protein